MNQENVVKKVIDILEKTKISYMLTGAVAVSFWGKPRSTHDLDYLQKWTKKQKVEKLLEELKVKG